MMVVMMGMRMMMSMRIDDDVCRLSLPTTSLGWPHQLLKLIGARPQEAAVVLLLMMMNAMMMMTMMIYVDCHSQHQRQLL